MSKTIITKIERKKLMDYTIDKNGNVIESSYNWFKDKYTLITIVIIILASLYYLEISKSETNAKNFPEYCQMYSSAINDFYSAYPNETADLYKVLEFYKEQKRDEINFNLPIK